MESVLRIGGIGRARIEHGDVPTGDIRHSVADPRASTAPLGVWAGLLLEGGPRRALESLSAVPTPWLTR